MIKISSLVLGAVAFSLSAEPAKYAETIYPHWEQTFGISKEIFHEKTDVQDLVIFDNPMFGRVLALDGVIQLTEADEPIYHEMLAHTSLLSHDHPASVLIIGGGDGGMLREVLRHPTVKRAVLVEIDSSVIELSKKYLPKVSNGSFEDPRVEVVIQDAAEYVKTSEESFDVIICDSSDPIGPCAVLFTSEFYGHCKELLTEGGIFVNMCGVPFFQKDELGFTYKNRKPHFEHVTYFVAPVPTYVGGFMALGWASDKDYQLSEEVLKKKFEKLGGSFLYYSPAIHKASFALPNYIVQQLEE